MFNESYQSMIDEMEKVKDVEQEEKVTIRIGNKLLKFEVVEEESLPIDELEIELKNKYNGKLTSIKKIVNEKMEEMDNALSVYKRDYEEKEKELSIKLKDANIMPDITEEHALQGLTMTKGHNGQYIWFYRGIYKPKFVDEKPIEPKYAQKLITPIIIQITTDEQNVISVKTRTYLGLNQFDHYHRYGGGDCWGSWHPSEETWKTVDDIVEIARRSLGILENINSLSLGTRGPKKLPKFNTLEKHLTSITEEVTVTTRNENVRLGEVEEEVNNTVDNMWSA